MAARDLVYKFDALDVADLKVSGEANIGYLPDGQWEVEMTHVDTALDKDGNEVDWSAMGRPNIKRPLEEQCAHAIQSAVDEAIYRRDG